MGVELPPPYRLVVKRDGDEDSQKSQGTAWFVTRSKVITAWHVIKGVIGDSGALSGIRFELEIGDEPIKLNYVPGSEDRDTDVAVLHVAEEDRVRVKKSMVLALSDRKPKMREMWSARGFPKDTKGKEQSADGHVTNPSTKDDEIELFVNQGTSETWAGISGAALIIDDRVAGLVTAERQHSTALARPYCAIAKIVPELKGRAQRRRYCEWFRDEFGPPSWCTAYAPNVTVTELTVSVDQFVDLMIAKRNHSRVWLIAGDQAGEREALLKRVVDSFVQRVSAEAEDCFDLPVWSTAPPYPNESLDPLRLTQEKLRESTKGISTSDADLIIAEIRQAMERGSALFVVDGAEVAEIDSLRHGIGSCQVLAGVSGSVAAKVHDAQSCRIAALSENDQQNLVACWITDPPQMHRWVKAGHEFLPRASAPLDVSIWCRAQIIFEQPKVGEPAKQGQTGRRIDLLKDLIEGLLCGRFFDGHPQTTGVQGEEARDFLEWLAYWTLIDGVEEVESTYLSGKPRLGLSHRATDPSYLDQISTRCGMLQKVEDNTYRFTHPLLQEYFAASAMYGSTLDLNLEKIAEHAFEIRDKEQITRWSRALALRLDSEASENDASKIVGTLLNYGLPPGYGTQLRNNAGKLSPCVCQAVLYTESLEGEKLRKVLEWCDFPKDWTGYRPDEWRAIEELLRYLDGVALRVRDDESLAQLFGRFLRKAKVIEIALIRYTLAKELRKRKQRGEQTKSLEQLYERHHFFELAGHPCSRDAEINITKNLRVIPEGWFLMGALPAEERSWPNERPQHRVFLDTYRITRTEVTNQQYEAFDDAHKDCRFSEDHPKLLMDNWQSYPVVRVSWYEAWCFAEWMGLKLPREA